MPETTIATHGEVTSLLNLVRDVQDLGLEIPGEVESERKLYRDLAESERIAQHEYDTAIARLTTVPAAEFDQARDAAVDASVRLFAANQRGMNSLLVAAATRRLQSAMFPAIADWERAVVTQMNELVSDYRLNEVAGDLPDLNQPGLSVLSLGKAQGEAVEAWRSAGPHLHHRWDLYKRLAQFNGHIIGPASSQDLATNLWTACALGDPGGWGRCQAAAVTMAGMNAGSDSARPWRPLVPFIVPALHGYELHLSTPDDAGRIRQRVQHASQRS